MSEVFELPAAMAISIVMFAIAYFLAVLSPVLLAVLTVWRQRKTMRRRFLFFGTVLGATYGFLAVLVIAICVPISTFLIFIVPVLKEQGHLKDSLFLALADFVVAWWWAFLPFAVLIPAFFISRYFAARWNGIVEALNG